MSTFCWIVRHTIHAPTKQNAENFKRNLNPLYTTIFAQDTHIEVTRTKFFVVHCWSSNNLCCPCWAGTVFGMSFYCPRQEPRANRCLQTARRIVAKATLSIAKADVVEVAGSMKLWAGHPTGAEAVVHSMRESFENDNNEMFLIDATNVFNMFNRLDIMGLSGG